MRRKLVVLAMVIMAVLCFTACTDGQNDGSGDGDKNQLKIEQVYVMAQEAGYTGTLDELIEAFKGDSAYQIAVSKGYSGSEADWLASLVGASGKDGKDGANGITPHIGSNGNWYIGNTNTGVKAKGQDGSNGTDGKSAYQIWLDNGNTGTEADFLEWLKGKNGANGENGIDGINGLSTYQIFKKYNPDYLGNEEQWINGLVNNKLIRYTITFQSEAQNDIIKTVFYGFPLTDVPEVPEKEGQTSATWDITDFSNITQDMTVTAVYDMRKYVTFHNEYTDKEDIVKTVMYGETLTDIPTLTKKQGMTRGGLLVISVV